MPRRPSKKASQTTPPPTPTPLAELRDRFPRLIGRWLDLFEASLDTAEETRREDPQPAKPPDAATLREVVNALTLCMRLDQLAKEGQDHDADTGGRDLEAVERALSEALR